MLFSPDEKIQPLQPFSAPPAPKRWSDPLTLRQHIVWHRRAGFPLYRVYCMEVLPAEGFFCAYAQGYKDGWNTIHAYDHMPEQMLSVLNRPPQLFPSLEEALLAYDFDSVSVA